jgi:hypothetical protein
MASLSDDLRMLADLEDDHKLSAVPLTADDVKAIDLSKINWQRLVCFAIPVFNMFGPIYGLPPLPVPAFCTTPVPPTPGPVG